MYVDNLETQDLEEICHQVLDLYIQQPAEDASAKDAADSPPQPNITGSAANSSITPNSRQSSIQNSENKVGLSFLIGNRVNFTI